MKEEYQQKYVISDGPEYKKTNFWYRECGIQKLPYICVIHGDPSPDKSCVTWGLEALPNDILKLFNESTIPLYQSIQNVIHMVLPDARVIGYSNSGGEVYWLEKDTAERVAEIISAYLFMLVELEQKQQGQHQ